MFSFFKRKQAQTREAAFLSELHDEDTFYYAFINDLKRAKKEVIIESPYIASARMEKLSSIFERLIAKEIKVVVVTRSPEEHIEPFDRQSEREIQHFEKIGVNVLISRGRNGHPSHRKLAIIDRTVLWEGSLNILSHSNNGEIMRRIQDKSHALEMLKFTRLSTYI